MPVRLGDRLALEGRPPGIFDAQAGPGDGSPPRAGQDRFDAAVQSAKVVATARTASRTAERPDSKNRPSESPAVAQAARAAGRRPTGRIHHGRYHTTRCPGSHSVSPYLICDGADDAIAFYVRAFGAEELVRLPGPEGRIMHACLRINGSTVMLSDEFPEQGMVGPTRLGGSPVTIHLMVPDVDATFARAVARGATPTMEVADQFWGDRYGALRDPFGHNWSIGTHVRDMTPEEIQAAMAQAMPA